MFRYSILIFILAFATIYRLPAFAQKAGKVEIIQDERIPGLIDKHIYLNQNGKLEGYRVQIFFDSGNNSKNRAFAKKAQFLSMFPEVGAYLTFQSPNYKVRVGDFRTRLDAEGFKAKIIMDFTDAFVVMDDINYPGLEN